MAAAEKRVLPTEHVTGCLCLWCALSLHMLLGPQWDDDLSRHAVAALPALFMSCLCLQILAFGGQLLGSGPESLCRMGAGLDSSASVGMCLPARLPL